MRQSAIKPIRSMCQLSGTGVECWVQNRHLRHRRCVHVSLNNPEQVQVLLLSSPHLLQESLRTSHLSKMERQLTKEKQRKCS